MGDALAGATPVEAVGLDAADVVGLHLVQGLHELPQLALEAASHGRELVALAHLALQIKWHVRVIIVRNDLFIQ